MFFNKIYKYVIVGGNKKGDIMSKLSSKIYSIILTILLSIFLGILVSGCNNKEKNNKIDIERLSKEKYNKKEEYDLDKELPKINEELVEYIEGYDEYLVFMNLEGNSIKAGDASFDADEDSKDELWDAYLADNFVFGSAQVSSIDTKKGEFKECTYDEYGMEGFIREMEDSWTEGYVWYNNKKEIEKIVSYGEIVIQDYSVIERTVPAICVEGTTKEDLSSDIKDGIYLSAKINKDGSITYEMCETQLERILEDKRQLFIDSIDEMIGEDIYGIVDIKYDKDEDTMFKNFTVKIKDEEDFKGKDTVTENLTNIGTWYQALQGKGNIKVNVEFNEIR